MNLPDPNRTRRIDASHPNLRGAHVPHPTHSELEQFRHLVFAVDAQLPQIVEFVETCPALQQAVLQAANSAEFGLMRPVMRFSHGIALLGLRRLQSLARSLAIEPADPPASAQSTDAA